VTDLLATTALTLSPVGIAPRAAPATVAGGFDLKLALDCVMPGVAPMAGKPFPVAQPTGKPIAGCGKDLPVPGNGEGYADPRLGEADTDEDDPLLVWMPEGLMPLPSDAPLPTRVAIAGTAMATPTFTDASVAAPMVELPESQPLQLPADSPAAATGAGEAPSLPASAAIAAPATAPISTPLRTPRTVPAQAEPHAGGGVVAAEVRIDRTAAAAPELAVRPIVVPPPVVQAAPAAQVFAAALAAPLVEPLDTAAPADPASPEIQLLRALEVQRTTVQATAEADQAPLDLSHDDWTGKMIERIAALRDGVEAADARIRLAPENLGTVDVAIRRDGDRLQVHFTAENPATRQLLADAAPRLAELAEARGLKLGQSSVDGGSSGERGQQQQPNHPSTPARPASARADTGTASDARIA
jgi:flagellar hook-length control protein FliK